MLPDSTEKASSVEQCLPGKISQGPRGEVFVMDSVREWSQTHGLYTFSALREVESLRLGTLLLEDCPALDLGKTAFIDTETTGLGYGVGTHVFMIGIGHVDVDGFRVLQFFLRHPGEEVAVISAVGEYLQAFTNVVSFNGRSFDWPLIENRFVYSRIPLQPSSPLHLDLLHISRRLWKLRLESCAMNSIERHILGVARTGEDVEGWVIPHLYFQYLRTGNARPLGRVFYHNLQDILSLALLSVHIERLLEDPWGGLVSDPVDFVSLGRLYQQVGDDDNAMRCYTHALGQGLPLRYEPIALLRLAILEKRRRNWDAAISLFHRVVERPGFERIACVELAKYHEHVARNHGEAARLTVRALKALDYPASFSWPGARRMELQHRHRRLSRRLAGASI